MEQTQEMRVHLAIGSHGTGCKSKVKNSIRLPVTIPFVANFICECIFVPLGIACRSRGDAKMVKFMASFSPNHLQARGAGALLVAALALAMVWVTPAGADSAFSLQGYQKFEDLAGYFLEAAPTNPSPASSTPHTKGSWLGTSQDINSFISAQEFLDIADFRISPSAIGRKQNSTFLAQDLTWLRSWKPLSLVWRRPHHT